MSKRNKYDITECKKDFQRTIKRKSVIKGNSPYIKGVCKIEIVPGDVNSGIVFTTKDGLRIPSLIEYAKNDDKVHTTSLISKNIEIKTVEHLLSAVWGLGIDNANIKMHSIHLPFLDASSKGYVEQINKAGLTNQGKLRKYIRVNKKVVFKENLTDAREAIFRPSANITIKSTTSFNEPIGTKSVCFKWDETQYEKEISFARTFLRSPLDNEGKVWDYVRKLFPYIPVDPHNSPIIVYDDKKFITPLYKEDEPARHKILDFIGDISLVGYRLLANIELNLPGHRFTRQIAREIRSEVKQFA